jgi:hypothetical protein
LDNQVSAGNYEKASEPAKPSRLSRAIENIKGYFEKSRAEKQKKGPEDRAATSTARATWAIAFLTLATIGVGISQYVIFDHQLKVMQGQLDVMHADQRPWIYITPPEAGAPAMVDERGFHFSIKFGFKSAGKEPASRVGVYHRASVIDFDENLRGSIKSLVKTVEDFCRSNVPDETGYTLPPGAEHTEIYNEGVSREDVIRGRDVRPGINVLFMGCVAYASAAVGNDTRYFTAFAFILHDKETGAAPIGEDGIVSTDRLVVEVVNNAYRVR